jgi:hypothetical protein
LNAPGLQWRFQNRTIFSPVGRSAKMPAAFSYSCDAQRLMRCDGEPVDPSPTVDQAINGGYPWLEIACSRCRTPRTVDLASLPHVPTTCVHDLAGRLRCEKCRNAGKRPPAELRQLTKRRRHDPDTTP